MNVSRPYRRPILAALTGTLGLVAVTAALYGVLWWVDFQHDPNNHLPWLLFGAPEAVDTIGGLGEVTIAVLGIALTVVAIIVELAANRYTPRITELFLRDPINGIVLTFFAVTAALVIATSMSLHGPTYPTLMVRVVVTAMIVSMLMILPYFLYVFDFLTPRSVIQRIAHRATQSLHLAGRGSRGRRGLSKSVEQLGDIALNSVQKKDKAIAIASVQALAEVAASSLPMHERLSPAWFDLAPHAADDHDFVSFHPDIIRRLTERRTWVETKVLRQYQSIFGESLTHLQDVAHIIAIHTRQLALKASDAGHEHAIQLCLHFIHTYFRIAINGRDVRTAYNVFNEYRMLAEGMLRDGRDDVVVQIADLSKYYGQLAFSRQLPFILETAAYDLCALLELAHLANRPCHPHLLDVFLELDREPDGGQHQEASLRGVRKAQVKLATHYLLHGEVDLARRIYEDMSHEGHERILSIRKELEEIVEPEFWEVSDRGSNFDWLPPERRAKLSEFFGWFDGR